MSRLLIVSNRLPVSVSRRGKSLSFQPSIGGLATGLSSFSRSHESLWFGWPGISKDNLSDEQRLRVARQLKMQKFYPVFLSKRDIRDYYQGFSNKTIWPLFHYFALYTIYEDRYWQAYKRVNRFFCQAVLKKARPGDNIWIHDYQLMLLPALIRKSLPEANIGFFLHIPFPSFELFRFLPWREKILEGLLGADLIGFHTYDYVRHFLSSLARIIGIEHSMGSLTVGNRILKVDAFPMGVDYDRYSGAIDEPKVRKSVGVIQKKVGDKKIIISIDRLDYTKGIIQRIEAFDLFLSKNPQYREKVTLILLAVPSRAGVEHYMELRQHLESLVGRINGEHGTIGWVPIWYLYKSVPFEKLVALYNIADVALVTPLRDGMNLIAKEFVATKKDGRGVLILSEMAGAVSELGEAIIVNANNKADIIDAIKQALDMPLSEQVERNRLMQNRLSRYNVSRWANDFLETLAKIKKIQHKLSVSQLIGTVREQLIAKFSKSAKRLFLLDYDGTLVGFTGSPQRAGPDSKLLDLLKSLGDDRRNEVVIISGRDKATLDRWLGGLNVSLVAEHGAWFKKNGKDWEIIESLPNNWKQIVRSIFELYTDRTPGSSIEEKDFSLVWHFRRADPELAYARTQELRDAVLSLTANMGVGVFEGSKILEVKNMGVSKGRVAKIWLEKQKNGFILAAGDDYTDEDLFSVLPKKAYSIKIGYGLSKARFSLGSVYELRLLLEDLVK